MCAQRDWVQYINLAKHLSVTDVGPIYQCLVVMNQLVSIQDVEALEVTNGNLKSNL